MIDCGGTKSNDFLYRSHKKSVFDKLTSASDLYS